MAFHFVRIKNLRNILGLEFNPVNGVNFIVGPNGSGKTSVLEAIYILTRGRSFRDVRMTKSITSGTDAFEIFGACRQAGRELRLGITASHRNTDVRINGVRLKRLSDLAREVPLQLITPRSHELLERGAENRRRFVEWGVFHVEPNYQHFSSRYRRALIQRNSTLRIDKNLTEIWDEQLAKNGEQVNRMREYYLDGFSKTFQSYLAVLIPEHEIDIVWRRGWPQDKSLKESLENNIKADVNRGFTQSGPHRADLVVTMGGNPVSGRASRGQQKMVVIAMFLAQARLIRERTDKIPIFLLDDIASELDEINREKVFSWLSVENCQAFVTTSETSLPKHFGYDHLFHVEHGEFLDKGV